MSNVFLFTGEETYLLQDQVTQWKTSFIEKHGDLNVSEIDATKTSFSHIMSECCSMPFLGDKRIVFIHNLPKSAADIKKVKNKEKQKAENDEIVTFLDNVPETSIVIFISESPDKRTAVYKKLIKTAEVKKFDFLSGAKLLQWIEIQLKEDNGKMNRAAIEYLIDRSGVNLWQLKQDIRKLAQYCGGRPIETHDIDLLVTPRLEVNIFHLIDAIIAKKHKRAFQLIESTIENGENMNQIFYMIIRQFRILIQIKYLLDQGRDQKSIASELKLHPFVVKSGWSQVRNFSQEKLLLSYSLLLKIDEKLKTGKIKSPSQDIKPFAMEIEKFIIDLA